MLLVLGVSESATVNNIIVAIKVTVILAFIAVGAFFVNPDNWHPFIPEPTGVENQFGIDGVIRAATIVFFAYIGFEAVSTAGQEAKNPRKDMPIGILGSLIICTVLYMLTAAVLTGVVSFTKLNVAAPVATAVDTFGPEWGWLAKCIKIGAIAGLSSVVLVLMFGQTRVFYSMSRDGLLPKTLAKVHPKFKTPWINTLIVGVLVSLAAAVFDINKLGDLTSVGTLVAFGLVCFSVIWLRAKRPDLPRHFKVWGYPVIPGDRRRAVLRARRGSASNTRSACGSPGSWSATIVVYFVYAVLGEPDAQPGARSAECRPLVRLREDSLVRGAKAPPPAPRTPWRAARSRGRPACILRR